MDKILMTEHRTTVKKISEAWVVTCNNSDCPFYDTPSLFMNWGNAVHAGNLHAWHGVKALPVDYSVALRWK